MELKSTQTSARVVRVSLAWLLTGVMAVIVLGMVGGAAAANWWLPRAVPLASETDDRLVATVQEVTISPNTAASETLAKAQRSVVAIGQGQTSDMVVAATGFVVTNDGMVVTTGELPLGQLLAYDFQGKTTPLELVGKDELFGLTYLKAREAVLIPLDIRTEEVPVAYELMAVGRSWPTLFPQAEFYRVNKVMLPPELLPAGIQRVYKGTQLTEATLIGSPLLDEEGRVAGVLVNPPAGLALPAGHLKESLDRVIGGQRELDLLADLGLELRYAFGTMSEGEEQRFVVEVLNVQPNSVAAAGGLKRGDVLVNIAGAPISWEDSVLISLTKDRPLVLTVNRAGSQLEVTLNELSEEN